MKTKHNMALALLVGIALGGVAIQRLHAQAKPPTYVVTDITAMTDPEGFKAVPASPGASPARLTALGGRYIIRTETITAIDGTPPKRFVVLAFDTKGEGARLGRCTRREGNECHAFQDNKFTCIHR
jgi:uncharacterized protein (DUF1330 family)